MEIKLEDIASVEEINRDIVYDISVQDNHNYFLDCDCDILVHNSSKTMDAFHFIYMFCDQNRATPLKVGIFRNTLKDCREKTYDDFKTFLGEKILNVYNPNNARRELTSPDYNLFGSSVEFRGLDEETEQKGYDIVFVNEALEISNERKIDGLKMRCRKLMLFDWNPKLTQHWIFKYEGRPNIFFTKTTYKNNKHLEKSIIAEIESKSPWMLEDLHLPEDERRPHLENIKNNTVDEWYFKVYGMGIRANRDGLVFPNVTWIDKFPDNLDKIGFGLDFGYTQDPSAFVKVGLEEIKTPGKKSNIYLELRIYEPTKEATILFNKINLVEPNIKDYRIWADSADPLMISDLRRMKLNIRAVEKTKGSIVYGCDLMNRFNIHIVECKEFKAEQENYAYKTIHGIQVNEPIDNFNHAWDASRYFVLSELRRFYLNSMK